MDEEKTHRRGEKLSSMQKWINRGDMVDPTVDPSEIQKIFLRIEVCEPYVEYERTAEWGLRNTLENRHTSEQGRACRDHGKMIIDLFKGT